MPSLVAVVDMELVVSAARFVGLTNRAATILRDQERVIAGLCQTVLCKLRLSRNRSPLCAGVWCPPLCFVEFTEFDPVTSIGFVVTLAILCLVSLLFGDLFRVFSPRQNVLTVFSVACPMGQWIFRRPVRVVCTHGARIVTRRGGRYGEDFESKNLRRR